MSYSPLPVTFRAGLGHVTSPPLAATGTFGAGLLDRRAGTTERLQRPVAVASHAEAPLTLVGSPGGEVDTFGVSTWAGAFGDVDRAGHTGTPSMSSRMGNSASRESFMCVSLRRGTCAGPSPGTLRRQRFRFPTVRQRWSGRCSR